MWDVDPTKAVEIVRDSGGEVVGRTRLQKIAFLLLATGLDGNFRFVYKHYGPFSNGLASAVRAATLLNQMVETEKTADWGGTYSVFHVVDRPENESDPRPQLARMTAAADAIVLELAATAVFLAKQNYDNPWKETKRRKPQKATKKQVNRAKQLLRRICAINTPVALPANVL